jgi:hypothetical protein
MGVEEDPAGEDAATGAVPKPGMEDIEPLPLVSPLPLRAGGGTIEG